MKFRAMWRMLLVAGFAFGSASAHAAPVSSEESEAAKGEIQSVVNELDDALMRRDAAQVLALLSSDFDHGGYQYAPHDLSWMRRVLPLKLAKVRIKELKATLQGVTLKGEEATAESRIEMQATNEAGKTSGTSGQFFSSWRHNAAGWRLQRSDDPFNVVFYLTLAPSPPDAPLQNQPAQAAPENGPPLVDPDVVLQEPHSRGVQELLFSPDGKTIASYSVIDQLRFSSASGTYRQTWDVPMFINSMCYAPDGRTLVTGHNDGKARLWEVKSGALLQELEVSQWSVYAVAVAPDNRTLAVDGATGGVQLWDMTRAQKLRVLSGKNAIQTLAFSSTGLLAASSDGEISVWQVASGRLLHRMTGETWVAFAEDGKTTVTATHDALRWRDSLNGALLREVLVPNPMRQLPAPRHGRISWLPIVSGFFFVPRTILSPDGSLAATLYTDGSIGLWETRTGEMRRLLKGFNRANVMGGGVTIFAFAPDGQRLVCGNQTGEVALWNVNPTKSFPKAVT